MSNHFNRITTFAHIGATISALAVAAGSTLGFHEMTGNWGTALLGGLAIASILGFGWFNIISMGARVRHTPAKVMTVLLGCLLVTAAILTSGWSVATAIGGRQSLAAYQTNALVEHELALADAMGRVNGQREFADIVSQHAVATSMLGDEEGLSGQGPLYRSYVRTASSLTAAANGMRSKINGAENIYVDGIDALDRANTQLGSAEAFRLSIGEVETVIAELNTIDVSSDILSIGMVGFNDRGLPELDGLTASLRAAGEAASVEPVPIPRYTPANRSDAIWDQRPLGPWAVAIAIDLAPLILLLMVMLAAGETLLREPRKIKGRKSDEQVRTEEETLAGAHLRKVAGE